MNKFDKINKLAIYFIKKYSYQIIDTKGLHKEIWLGCKANNSMPLLRISNTSMTSISFEKERVIQTSKMIRDVLNSEGIFIDLHLDNDLSDDSIADFKQIAISKNGVSNKLIYDFFPDILKTMQKIDNNDEFHKILSSIKSPVNKDKVAKMVSKRKIPKVTNAIFLVCLIVYLGIYLINYLFVDDLIVSSLLFGAYYKSLILVNHEWFRVFTSGFVHISAMHLLVNMLALVSLGRFIEKTYSVKQYLSILFVSIIVGNLFVYIGSGNIVAVGLSGGLYGLLAAIIVYSIESNLIKTPAFKAWLFPAIFINLAINFLPNVSYLAHLGGFVAGLLLSFALQNNKSFAQIKQNATIAGIGLFFILLFLAIRVDQIDVPYIGTDLAYSKALENIGLKSYAHYINHNTIEYYSIQGE